MWIRLPLGVLAVVAGVLMIVFCERLTDLQKTITFREFVNGARPESVPGRGLTTALGGAILVVIGAITFASYF